VWSNPARELDETATIPESSKKLDVLLYKKDKLLEASGHHATTVLKEGACLGGI
jgi:hypothetical protein